MEECRAAKVAGRCEPEMEEDVISPLAAQLVAGVKRSVQRRGPWELLGGLASAPLQVPGSFSRQKDVCVCRGEVRSLCVLKRCGPQRMLCPLGETVIPGHSAFFMSD
jgi:hypothetical protein